MSLFGRSGMTHADEMAVAEALKQLAEAVGDRLRGHDAEIAELRAEIERLKSGPRMTVAQRARAKGKA